MSKIFINHTFKCVSVTTLTSTPEEIIETMCSDIDSVCTKRILNKISNAIIINKLYMGLPSTVSSYSGIIPLNSKLYSNSSNTSDVPDIQHVRDLLEVKLKIDDVEDDIDVDVDDEKLLAGHFRFYLPPIIQPQFVIFVKCANVSNKLLLMYHGNSKFLPIFTSYIQNTFDCTLSDIQLNNLKMNECLNWCIDNDTLDSIGDFELWFGKLQTSGKLGSILMTIKDRDVKNLKQLIKNLVDPDDFSDILYEYLESQSSISFNRLALVKLKCQLFTISCDGKIKFTSSMSHIGHNEKLKRKDERLSIWWIIRKLSE